MAATKKHPWTCPECSKQAEGKHCASPTCNLYVCTRHADLVVFGWRDKVFHKPKNEKTIA